MNAEELAVLIGGRYVGYGHWLVPCPDFDDVVFMLSIQDYPSHRIELKAYAGISEADILIQLGIPI
jgi:hypothetical protein